MGMKRVLDDAALEQVKVLYSLGASKTDIAIRFKCSITTIATWLETPEVRKKIFNKRVHSDTCKKCLEKLNKHTKCPYCGILIHDIPCDCPTRYKTQIERIYGIKPSTS